MKIQRLLLFLCFFYWSALLRAQNYPVRNFSVKDGLPSGIVYSCLQDRHGFMWFATEAGLARFDGTNFKVFTTQDGLTNNAILQIFEDTDGSIWIFPFGTTPCIFDFKSQRILNENTEPILRRFKPYTEHKQAFSIPGGIGVQAIGRIWLIEKRNITEIAQSKQLYLTPWFQGTDTVFYITEPVLNRFVLNRVVRKDSGWLQTDTSFFEFENGRDFMGLNVVVVENWNQGLVMANNKSLIFLEFQQKNGGQFIKRFTYQLPWTVNTVVAITDKIYVNTRGGIYVFSNCGQFLFEEMPGYSIAMSYIDSQSNKWYCGLDGSGVMMSIRSGVQSINSSYVLQNSNVSAITTNNRILFAGDSKGNLFEIARTDTGHRIVKIDHISSKIRELKPTPDGRLWGIQDEWYFVFENRRLHKLMQPGGALKSFVLMPDGIFVANGFGISRLTKELKFFQGPYKFDFERVSCITHTGDTFYWGNNKGLFKSDKLISHWSSSVPYDTLDLREPVTALLATRENLLWAGTSTKGLYIYYKDRLIRHLDPSGRTQGVNYTIKKIVADPGKNIIWLATNRGVQRIRYSFSSSTIELSTTVISSKEGLSDNDVNDIAIQGDSVYVATIKGISYFHESLNAMRIPLRLTGLGINNDSIFLPPDSVYRLAYNQNNITFHFSGICFSCSDKVLFEFRLLGTGRDTGWVTTMANTVEFGELAPGKYRFQIRTDWSDINETTVFIKKAFWQQNWFYALLTLGILALIYLGIRIYIRRIQKTQEERIRLNKKFAELELQALQSQMNPHFIFNSMNSLQNFILTNNIQSANEYLSRFSRLLRLFLDASRSRYITIQKEIELLQLYIELEQMREIASFEYTFTIDGGVNRELMMPSVIIQPFVENAIMHGLRYTVDRKGHLTVSMYMEGEYFVCVVDDNGVGREKVKQILSNRQQQYQSYGTRIIDEKIETLRSMEDIDIQIEIVDKPGANGTKVVIRFKPK